jgi:glucose-6-phosphate-specific signal transduction histidine kinase
MRGLGLIGIRERASQLRGAVQIDSVPGGGTRVVIDLPRHDRVAPSVDAILADTAAVAPSVT